MEKPDISSLPQNIEAEQALLGALLANNRAFESISDYLKPNHFADPIHAKIYEVISKLLTREHVADVIMLKKYFEQEGTLNDVGGYKYLVKLAESSSPLTNPEYYAQYIYEQYLRRDFPRVPIINEPEDVRSAESFHVSEEMFRIYSAAGAKLRRLHLMTDKIPAALSLDPSTAEDMEIGAVKYKDGVLQLNANKRIVGIPKEVWDYQIGGYQVLDKWFKSHKGEALTLGSFTHIENIVGLIAETCRIQNELRKIHQPGFTTDQLQLFVTSSDGRSC